MAQQTAVEWLLQRLILNGTIRLTYTEHPMYKELSKQAKEMEKQQIEAAWKRGDGEHDKVADKLAKQYYTETYGK
jgi:transcriptional regulator with PAS, ATPase and Fis domain